MKEKKTCTINKRRKKARRKKLFPNPDGCCTEQDLWRDPTNKKPNGTAKPFGKLYLIKRPCKTPPQNKGGHFKRDTHRKKKEKGRKREREEKLGGD